MKNRHPDEVLNEIAREHFSGKSNLLPDILSKASAQTKNTKKPFKWYVVAPATILLIILALVYAPVAVEAVTRLLAYIPGIGLVDNNRPLRELSESIQVKRKEGNITIQQALLDSKQSVVVYSVENLLYSSDPSAKRCTDLPYLRLPDGKRLTGDAKGTSWNSGYSRRVVYPVLPADINDVTLVFSCLEQTSSAVMNSGIEINLHFVALSPDKTVYPLMELPAPTLLPTAAPRTTPTTKPASSDQAITGTITAKDFEMRSDSYAALQDGYLLYGTLKSLNRNANFVWFEDSAVHLLNAAGQEFTLSNDELSERQPDLERGEYPLSYKSTPLSGHGPFTLRLDSINIDQSVNVSFVFDPGPNAAASQTWEFNRKIEIAGQSLEIESVMLDESRKNLTFIFTPNSVIQSAVLSDADLATQDMGGGGGTGAASISYPDGFPNRAVNVEVTLISYQLPGPWQTTFDLPVNPTQAEEKPADSQKTCLSRDSWQQAALRENNDKTSELNGKLSIYYLTEELPQYHVMVANLDGSSPQDFGRGDGGSLSPDGTKLIYSTSDGLALMDLKSMQKMVYNGSSRADRNALWSPDGKRFAFTRGPASGLIGVPGPHQIWLSDWNGANAQPLDTGYTASTAQAWTPDGNAIIYTVEQQDGASVEMINIHTAEKKALFKINYKNAGVAISPDGAKVAYEEMLPGEHYGISLSNLDGSNKRLLSDPYPYIATAPIWSPDGKWIMVSVHDPDSADFSPDLGLIEVDTCLIVRLPQLKGYVSTWLAGKN